MEFGPRPLEGLVSDMDWARSRVFVTGATGLIGSWLVKRLLEARAQVVALIRDWDPQSELIRSGAVYRISVVSGALEEYATLERAINEHEVDTVIHLGAQTIVGTALRSPLPTFEANIRGTYNLLEACRIHRDLVQRVVVASSDKAYGEADVLPYTEEMTLGGRHPYDVSKTCSDIIATAYAHTYGLPVAVARCGNVYGGGDLQWSRLVPGTIRSVLRGERPILRSNGRYVRDYVYVADVVDGYVLLASRAAEDGIRGEAFNFSTGVPVTVLEMVTRITSLMGRSDLEPVILDEAKAEIETQYLDATKARRRLGWTPRYAIGEALEETITWYRNFLSAIERLPVG